MTGDEATIAGGEQTGPEPVLAPRRLGRYVLLEELGRGGMGAVFGAYDPELDRKIAVKVLAGDGGDPTRQARLLREAQALARLAHPNVVAVHDVGLIDGQVYVAMEYVQGESLRAWLGRGRSLRELLDMFIQAGRGLAAAHAVGLIHRDFKPDNVVVGRDGRARVLDFGLAALAGTAADAGAPARPDAAVRGSGSEAVTMLAARGPVGGAATWGDAATLLASRGAESEAATVPASRGSGSDAALMLAARGSSGGDAATVMASRESVNAAATMLASRGAESDAATMPASRGSVGDAATVLAARGGSVGDAATAMASRGSVGDAATVLAARGGSVGDAATVMASRGSVGDAATMLASRGPGSDAATMLAGRGTVGDATVGPPAGPASGAVVTRGPGPVGDVTTARSHVPKASLLASRLTAAGALMGTLAYMSPEQYAGAELDAATDQFSFCVALYEAVCGQRPFAGESPAEYALAVTAGAVRPPPRGAEVPRWLLRALQRGLAVDRRARFPDMPALLAELTRDRGRVRRGLGSAGAAVVVAAGVFAATRVTPPAAEAPCSGAAAEVAAVWDDDRRAAVERAFAATGLAYAAETLARVGPRLDALAGRWAAVHTATCQAHQRGELSDALFDRQMMCLKGQLRGVAARVEVLARADAAAVERAAVLVDGLPPAEDCADPAKLLPERLVPADARVAAEVAAVRERLVAAEAEHAAGHYDVALAAADGAAIAARALAQPAVVAEAEMVAAYACHGLAEFRQARERALQALWAALEVDHVESAATAALLLLALAADELADARDGALWRGQARALVRRLGGEDTRDGVALRTGMAQLALLEEDRDEALRLSDEAVALAERIVAPDDLLIPEVLGAAGRIRRNYELFAEAHRDYARAREIFRARLGDNHPMLAHASHNLGAVLEDLGRIDESEAAYLEAIRLIEGSIGPDAAAAGFVYNNLSDIYVDKRDLARAEASARKAVEIFEREFGPDHPRTALGLNNLASVLGKARREAEALPLFERSVAIYEKTLGPDRYDVAFPVHGLGTAVLAAGDLPRAEALFRRALALTTAGVGADHVENATEHLWLGRTLLLQRRAREAAPSLERALALWTANDRPSRAGEARFLLAQALWQLGGRDDRARALREAAQAAATIDDGDPQVRVRRAEVTAWLAAHKLP
ncbi:Tetratricopeptide repeat-containing protein [Nannocystis exedens]|uniref:Tetratricopeptide repeat-containing protein n=1 Tax=Nannocystis exedens TaxID=54 RepID=A0A1I1UST7_9BACT|nr:tetratricopeptide repeat protein [Nannocystis exedens]PCC72072.1 protein kinase [Nannocystis exedens]SFD73846.1 Tetratricopeptide repeat-containing protein [Nannocystis exedens]